MSQVYHSNARTNQHVRQRIQQSDLTNVELSDNYNVNRLLLKPFSIFGYMSLRSYFNLKYKSNFNITKI